MRKIIFSLCLLLSSTAMVAAQQHDLVLEGGRVMDPETGLDAVRNVAILGGKIIRGWRRASVDLRLEEMIKAAGTWNEIHR